MFLSTVYFHLRFLYQGKVQLISGAGLLREQGKLYSTHTDYARQNGTVHQGPSRENIMPCKSYLRISYIQGVPQNMTVGE